MISTFDRIMKIVRDQWPDLEEEFITPDKRLRDLDEDFGASLNAANEIQEEFGVISPLSSDWFYSNTLDAIAAHIGQLRAEKVSLRYQVVKCFEQLLVEKASAEATT